MKPVGSVPHSCENSPLIPILRHLDPILSFNSYFHKSYSLICIRYSLWIFTFSFSVRILKTFYLLTTRPSHHDLLTLITLKYQVNVQNMELLIMELSTFPLLSLLDLNIHLKILCSKIFSLYSFLKVSDNVSQLYSTKYMIIFYVLSSSDSQTKVERKKRMC